MITESATFVRSVSMRKVQCNWCFAPATWQIEDEFGEIEFVCTVHGSEWFPSAFPGSATMDEVINEILDLITRKMTMCSRCDRTYESGEDWNVWTYGCDVCTRPNPVGVGQQLRRPWYPSMGDRKGVRMNGRVTLASAFNILALEGGTAHQSAASEAFAAK